MNTLLVCCAAVSLLMTARQKGGRLATLVMAVAVVNPGFAVFSGFTPVRLLGVLLCAHEIFRRREKIPTRIRLLLALATLGAVVSLFSPDKHLGYEDVIDVLSAAGILLYFAKSWESARVKTDVAHRVLLSLAPLVLCAAISICYFRFNNAAEISYYPTSLARFLQGNYASHIADSIVDANVTSPEKAGGLFFNNGNRASLMMGVAACAYLCDFAARRSRSAFIMLVVCVAGVGAAGSKTGLAIGAAIPFFLWLVVAARRRDGQTSLLVVLVGMLPIVGVGVFAVRSFATTYVSAVDETLSPRRLLWSTAVKYIGDAPIFGHGYGSWAPHWEPVAVAHGVSTTFPPHDYILLNWIQLGVLGAVLSVMIPLASALAQVRRFGAALSRWQRVSIGSAVVAWLWVLLHGLGDNTFVYGLLNIVPFLAVLDALTTADPPGSHESREDDPQALETGSRVGVLVAPGEGFPVAKFD